MIHSDTESSPASGAHAHQYVFPHVHFGIGPFKHSVYIGILTWNEIRHAKRYDSLSFRQILLRFPVKGSRDRMTVLIILPLQDHFKFIAAKAEHRAVAEVTADDPACGNQQLIPRFMPIGVVGHLQSVYIEGYHGKFPYPAFFNFRIQLLFIVFTGPLVLYAGKGILVRKAFRGADFYFLLLLDLQQFFQLLLILFPFVFHHKFVDEAAAK